METTHDSKSRTPKSQRLNVRVTERQEALIRRAAEATDRSMTDFILESASLEAERILADKRWFFLSEAAWDEFNRLLDLPLETSKLERLAKRTSPFEAEGTSK